MGVGFLLVRNGAGELEGRNGYTNRHGNELHFKLEMNWKGPVPDSKGDKAF